MITQYIFCRFLLLLLPLFAAPAIFCHPYSVRIQLFLLIFFHLNFLLINIKAQYPTVDKVSENNNKRSTRPNWKPCK